MFDSEDKGDALIVGGLGILFGLSLISLISAAPSQIPYDAHPAFETPMPYTVNTPNPVVVVETPKPTPFCDSDVYNGVKTTL